MTAKGFDQLEPVTREFLESLAAQGAPPIDEQTVDAARRGLSAAQGGAATNLPVDLEDRTIPGGKLGEISIRVFRPQGRSGVLPAVMYFHGGGWVLGDRHTHDRLVRELSIGAEAAIVFVNFTPSPEARYPIANEQAYAATKWVAEHGAEMQLDGARLAVAGDSAGGNMAAAVTLMAKDRKGPGILQQVLFYPVTDARFDTGSYRDFGTGYPLTTAAMRWFWSRYAPDESARAEPTASPLRASLEQLQGLPPALVLTAEFDVLRDEGEAYAHKLAQAGVRVTAARHLGTIHDFVMLNALSETPAARAAIAQAVAALRDKMHIPHAAAPPGT